MMRMKAMTFLAFLETASKNNLMGNGGGGAKLCHYIMCHHFAGTGINA
jgi:hypothetical protein